MMSGKEKGRVLPTKPKKEYTTMLIDPGLTGGYRRVRRGSLDAEFDADDDAQARELRDLRVKKLILKREAEIAKLQRDIKEVEESPTEARPGEASKISGISINVARQIAALPEEEQDSVLRTYMLLQAAEAKHANAVLPAIVGFAKANPGSARSDMVEFAKAMTQQLETGLKIGQAGKTADPYKPVEMMIDLVKETRPQAAADPYKPVEIIMDLIKETVQKPIKDMADKFQPQPGFFEQLLMNPQLFDRAKELGIFARREGSAGTSEMDLKIEELRTERELGIKKLDLEWRKSLLEREASDKRTDTVISALAPISALLAGPVTRKMRQLGQQTASRQPTENPAPPMNTVLIKCPCGYEGNKTFPSIPPPSFNCPKCGQELVIIGGAPGAGNPKEPDTGT